MVSWAKGYEFVAGRKKIFKMGSKFGPKFPDPRWVGLKMGIFWTFLGLDNEFQVQSKIFNVDPIFEPTFPEPSWNSLKIVTLRLSQVMDYNSGVECKKIFKVDPMLRPRFPDQNWIGFNSGIPEVYFGTNPNHI